MSYVITTPFHKNYEEKLRVGRKRVILLNCAHRDCIRSDVKAERSAMEAWELMVAASDLGKKRGTNKRIEELNPDKRMEPHQVVLEGKKLRHTER